VNIYGTVKFEHIITLTALNVHRSMMIPCRLM